MRNPEPWRNAAIALFLAGPASAIAAFALPQGALDDELRGALFAGGMMLALFAGIAALMLQQSVKRQRRPASPLQKAQADIAQLFESTEPESRSTCWKCGFQTFQAVALCERCGEPMLSMRWTRRYGAILIVLGLLLGIGGSVLLAMELPVLLHPGVEVDGSTFTGSASMARSVILIFITIAVFGVTALGYGIYQLVTGRRSLLIMRIMLAIVGGMYLLGWAIKSG